MAYRTDAPERIDAIARRGALFTIDRALQSLRVPSHHAIGDECKGSRSSDELLGFATAFGRESLRADLALQGVHGLTAIEDLVDRAAKIRQCEMVAQIYGAQQLSERVAGIGLASMRERVEGAGGHMLIRSGSSGTTIEATLPLSDAEPTTNPR